jgi:hypothetical protein
VQALLGRVALGLGQLALLDRAVERLPQPRASRPSRVVVDLANDHVQARAGADLGDAPAHLPATDDSQAFDLGHHTVPFRSRPHCRYATLFGSDHAKNRRTAPINSARGHT